MDKETKRRRTEGLLAIFLGCFGAHNFYRGEIGAGILRIILGWSGIAILASPLPSMIHADNLGDGIIMALVYMYIVMPIAFGAPVISIIKGIKEGINILQNNNSLPKKEQIITTDQNINILQLNQNATTENKNLQDIYPNPKNQIKK